MSGDKRLVQIHRLLNWRLQNALEMCVHVDGVRLVQVVIDLIQLVLVWLQRQIKHILLSVCVIVVLVGRLFD